MILSRLFLIGFIILVFFLIFTSVLLSVCRRVWNAKRYKKLDSLRDAFRKSLNESIMAGSLDAFVNDTKMPPGSLKWQALEQVLLETCEEGQKKNIIELFRAFGYVGFYQKQLSDHSSPIKLSAIVDKLGRMGDPSSIDLLGQLLQHKSPEVVTVAFRSLCRIGTGEALNRILNVLPELLRNKKITVKSIQTSLLLFDSWATEPLLKYARTADETAVLSVIIETLITFPVNHEMFEFALSKLSHPEAEVRAKALRILSREEIKGLSRVHDPKLFESLLNDPVWFVRLQVARAVENLRCDHFEEMLKKLILDEQWQVRDIATSSLIRMGEASLDAFLELLETNDRFAKESISEAIERTNYKDFLIQLIGGPDSNHKNKAMCILELMDQVGFSTPMKEAIEIGYISADREAIEVLQTGGIL